MEFVLNSSQNGKYYTGPDSMHLQTTTVGSLYLEVRGTFVKTSSYRKFDV